MTTHNDRFARSGVVNSDDFERVLKQVFEAGFAAGVLSKQFANPTNQKTIEKPSVLPAVDNESISQDELVQRWKVSKKTIRRLRQMGKLPALEITPALFRFKLSDIQRLENEGKLMPSIAPRKRGRPKVIKK